MFASDSQGGQRDTDLCRNIVRRLGVDLAQRLMQAVVRDRLSRSFECNQRLACWPKCFSARGICKCRSCASVTVLFLVSQVVQGKRNQVAQAHLIQQPSASPASSLRRTPPQQRHSLPPKMLTLPPTLPQPHSSSPTGDEIHDHPGPIAPDVAPPTDATVRAPSRDPSRDAARSRELRPSAFSSLAPGQLRQNSSTTAGQAGSGGPVLSGLPVAGDEGVQDEGVALRSHAAPAVPSSAAIAAGAPTPASTSGAAAPSRDPGFSNAELAKSVSTALQSASIEDLSRFLDLTRWSRRLRSIGIVAGARLGSNDGGSDVLQPEAANRTKSFLRHCSSCCIPVAGSTAAESMGGSGSVTVCPVKGLPCTFIRKALSVTKSWKRFNLQAPTGPRARAVDFAPEMGRVRQAMAAGNASAAAPLESLRKIVEAALQRSLASLQTDEAALQHILALRGVQGAVAAAKRGRDAALSTPTPAAGNEGVAMAPATRRSETDEAAKRIRPAAAASEGARGMVSASIIPQLAALTSDSHPFMRCHTSGMPQGRGGGIPDMTVVAALSRAEVVIPAFRPPTLAPNTAAFALLQGHCLSAQPLRVDGQRRVICALPVHPGVPL